MKSRSNWDYLIFFKPMNIYQNFGFKGYLLKIKAKVAKVF